MNVQIAVNRIRLNNVVHRHDNAVKKVMLCGARALVDVYLDDGEPASIELPLDPDEAEILATLALAVENRVRRDLKERL